MNEQWLAAVALDDVENAVIEGLLSVGVEYLSQQLAGPIELLECAGSAAGFPMLLVVRFLASRAAIVRALVKRQAVRSDTFDATSAALAGRSTAHCAAAGRSNVRNGHIRDLCDAHTRERCCKRTQQIRNLARVSC